ncbi:MULTISPECIES: GTP-binding protein [Nocardiopsis]|uniref:GTP-binding protein n=1 Tax=Nocardiopsis sinuspersici TaxID=501010 RepID=A0A1V3C061_9ACTN|nr:MULTISPECIES: GTP-binding protein [Nocardiopsis]OOC53869.1 GTP-binding protein [Nocardiopsis sinuspersici]
MPSAPATLNIGIVAHVDAGKTSLTERLLFDAGAIDRLGSVDSGDTRTDSGRIERERGITVRTAVAPFRAGPVQINLIDTPGHTDFVAEVERALSVLDGAVLVLSAVEGVQAHTRSLTRVLREAGLPTVLFVNKADRRGARPDGVLADIRRLLYPHVLALNRVHGAGTPDAHTLPLALEDPAVASRAAEVLAERDEDLLTRLVEDLPLPDPLRLRGILARQVAHGSVCPVVFGSALTGRGTPELVDALTSLFPVNAPGPGTGEPHGTVFSIERSASGEKTAYLRLRSGRLAARESVLFERPDGDPHRGRVTHLEVVGARPGEGRTLEAGQIGRIRGLPGIRVGDRLGPAPSGSARAAFARPSLESLARPRRPGQGPRLHAALAALADQDPLIGVRTVPGRGVSVLLYGEVQKEVVAATLAEDFGVEAVFEPSSVVYTERPNGVGRAVQTFWEQPPDGFPATVGLRVEPGERDSGVVFRREVELGALLPSFDRALVETVHHTLEQGLYGWQVTDCVVVLTHSGFTPGTTARDFRCLTPMVLMRALLRAGTRVLAPVHAFVLEVPAHSLNRVLPRLTGLGGRVHDSVLDAHTWTLTGEMPTSAVHTFQSALPGLTGGRGLWLGRRSGSRPVTGTPPRRARTDGNPLNRQEYLIHLGRSGPGGHG